MVHCTSPFPYLFIFIGISISGMAMSIVWGQHADRSGNIVCMTPQYSHIYLVDIVGTSEDPNSSTKLSGSSLSPGHMWTNSCNSRWGGR
jgi:hypothetical protein